MRMHSKCLTGDVFGSAALRLRPAAPRRDAADGRGGARRHRVPRPGRAGHRAAQQAARLRPPGRGRRHGRGQRAARVRARPPELRHRRPDPARPRPLHHPPHDQQSPQAGRPRGLRPGDRGAGAARSRSRRRIAATSTPSATCLATSWRTDHAGIAGRLGPVGRVAILVSRYHERVTGRLLDGARLACREAGLADAARRRDAGPRRVRACRSLAEAAARTGRYACLVALGAVVRGETPHFEYVAGETSRVLAEVAREHALPVGFGLLTTDTIEQALDARRAARPATRDTRPREAALATADRLARLPGRDAPA